MTQYDSYVAEIAGRHAEYEELLKEKTSRIRETEAENMRQGKKRTRDLDQFRRALHQLQEQVAEVEVCKRTYYSEVLDGESQMWDMIAGKVALLVRSTLDLSDRLASKSTADPVIEAMLNEHPDPFDSYRLDRDEADVLTVLPPIGLVGGTSTPLVSAAKAGDESGLSTVPEADQTLDEPAEESAPPPLPPLETPRQLAKTPVSVSDVLGLQDPIENGGGRSSPPAPDTPKKLPLDAVQTPARPRASSSASGSDAIPTSSVSTPDSNANSPALEESLTDPPSFTAPPSLTIESAPFVPSPNPTPSRKSPSRLSASEATDPMAGDWNAPVYGRSLSMHDGSEYDSGEVSLPRVGGT